MENSKIEYKETELRWIEMWRNVIIFLTRKAKTVKFKCWLLLENSLKCLKVGLACKYKSMMYQYKKKNTRAIKQLIAIKCIHNKSLCTVYIYYVYIINTNIYISIFIYRNTHTCMYIF